MRIKRVTDRVLKKIIPPAKEEKEVRNFVRELIAVSKTVSGLDVMLVGSIGKGTWLRGNHDIDLFIMFPKTVSREEVEKKGLVYGKRISRALGGKIQIKYAEHPYVRIRAKSYDIDVVPCYRIARGDNIISAVDRSPLHLEYILENIGRKKDDVRLLKRFCKGIGIYGSDAKTEGFSGYICELLVIKYGSFGETVRKAAEWKAPQYVSGGGDFKDQPLIIIDPVDANRNAAAVVSPGNFIHFVNKCKEFIKRPTERIFFPEPRGLMASQIKKLNQRKTKFIAVRMKRPDVVEDTLYPQMRRALRRIVSLLEDEEFRVLRYLEHANKYIFLILELEVWNLPATKKMVGPPIYSHKHLDEFLKKYHKNHVYIERDRVTADISRKNREAVKLLKKFFTRSPEKLREDGIPGYLAAVAKKTKILEDSAFFGLLKTDQKLSELVRKKYFEEL